MSLLLDLMKPLRELFVEVLETGPLDIDLLLLFELFEFLEVDCILALLLFLLLAGEEVRDELVKALVLIQPDPLPFDLLLVVHELVVAVSLVDALVQFHLPQTLSAVQHVLVVVQLSLQLFFLITVVVRFKKDARVVRGACTSSSTHSCCLSTSLNQ